MASGQNNGDERQGLLTNRRSVLKMVGATGLAAVSAGTAAAAPEGSFSSTVDLGNQGLASGDTIDSYLEEHLTSGTKVVVPAGEYDWNGGGVGGEYENAALVGDGEVVFNRPEPSVQVRTSITATGGTVTFQNITVRGKAGEEQSRIRVQATSSSARLVFDNVNMPDGTVSNSDSTAFYGGDAHAGELVFENCFFANWGNLALYVDSMGQSEGADGPIEVSNCVFVNNNAAAVKFGSSNSHVHDSLIVNDAAAPTDYSDGRAQRGLKIDVPGDDVVVENMDFYHTDAASEPIELDGEGQDGSGTIRNVRAYNGSDAPVVEEKWDAEGSWSGANFDLTGPGELSVPSYFTEVCTGDSCKAPVTDRSAYGTSSGGASSSSGGTTAGTDATNDTTNTTTTSNATSTATTDDAENTTTSEDGDGESETTTSDADEDSQSGDDAGTKKEGSSEPATTTDQRTGKPEGTPVVVLAVEDGPKFQYEFSVDGDASKVTTAGNLASEGNDSISSSDGEAVVDGEVGNGYGDKYRVTGELSAFTATTSAENFTVRVDGDDVTGDLVEGDGGEQSAEGDGESDEHHGKSEDRDKSGDRDDGDQSEASDGDSGCAFERED